MADLTERNQRSEEVIEQLRVAENNARIQAENENKRADHAEGQLVEIHEAFEGEKLRLRDENNQLAEDVATEREWREAAQAELDDLKAQQPLEEMTTRRTSPRLRAAVRRTKGRSAETGA